MQQSKEDPDGISKQQQNADGRGRRLAAVTARGEEGDKVKCYGVNSCKGTSACSGAGHGCAGKNACKGQGFLQMSKDDCMKQGGKLTEPGPPVK